MSSTDLLIVSGIFAVVAAVFAVWSNARKGQEADAKEAAAEAKSIIAKQESEAKEIAMIREANEAAALARKRQDVLVDLAIVSDREKAELQRQLLVLNTLRSAKSDPTVPTSGSLDLAVGRKLTEAFEVSLPEALKQKISEAADVQRREHEAVTKALELNSRFRPLLVEIIEAFKKVLMQADEKGFFPIEKIEDAGLPERIAFTMAERKSWSRDGLLVARSTRGETIYVSCIFGLVTSPPGAVSEAIRLNTAPRFPEIRILIGDNMLQPYASLIFDEKFGRFVARPSGTFESSKAEDLRQLAAESMVIALREVRVVVAMTKTGSTLSK